MLPEIVRGITVSNSLFSLILLIALSTCTLNLAISWVSITSLWDSCDCFTQERWPINFAGHNVINSETLVRHHCHVLVQKRDNARLPKQLFVTD